MPAPVVVYVVTAIGTVAAVIAFKEFVYDPYIAPKVELLSMNLSSGRRPQKYRAHKKQPHRPYSRNSSDTEDEDDRPSRATGSRRKMRGEEVAREGGDGIGLVRMLSQDVADWRREVHQSQGDLRQRRTAPVAIERNQVIFDESNSPVVTPRPLSPAPILSHRSSADTLRSPKPATPQVGRASTPSTTGSAFLTSGTLSSDAAYLSPRANASDALEVLSASSFSSSGSDRGVPAAMYQTAIISPQIPATMDFDVLSVGEDTDDDDDLFSESGILSPESLSGSIILDGFDDRVSNEGSTSSWISLGAGAQKL